MRSALKTEHGVVVFSSLFFSGERMHSLPPPAAAAADANASPRERMMCLR